MFLNANSNESALTLQYIVFFERTWSKQHESQNTFLKLFMKSIIPMSNPINQSNTYLKITQN